MATSLLLLTAPLALASEPRIPERFTRGQTVAYPARRKLGDDPTSGFQNLRLHAHFVDSQIDQTHKDFLTKLVNDAVVWWETALLVLPADGPIYGGFWQTCGDATIPDAHFKCDQTCSWLGDSSCDYDSTGGPSYCGYCTDRADCGGPSGGPGVPNSDFVPAYVPKLTSPTD